MQRGQTVYGALPEVRDDGLGTWQFVRSAMGRLPFYEQLALCVLDRVKIDEAMIIREDAEGGRAFKLTFEREAMGVIVRVIGYAYPAQHYTDKHPVMHTSVKVELDCLSAP